MSYRSGVIAGVIGTAVVAGAGGRSFVSGADISQFEKTRATPEQREVSEKIRGRGRAAIANFGKPTIAMVRGYCLGAGLNVALLCDLRVASDDAKFGVPAAKLGVGYGYETSKLISDLVGPAFGKEMLFTGRHFDAHEALRIGLVNRVVPGDQLEQAVKTWTDAIGANAPLSVAAAKLAFDAAILDPAERNLAAVDAAVERAMNSDDFKEGRRAFMERRKPVFRGA